MYIFLSGINTLRNISIPQFYLQKKKMNVTFIHIWLTVIIFNFIKARVLMSHVITYFSGCYLQKKM